LRTYRFQVFVLLAAIWVTELGKADVIFPARLQIGEVAPGTYDVAFTLPFIEGRVLRARPILPPICQETTERKTDRTWAGVTTTWQVRCEPASLAGEVIWVEGLLGTQTDLSLELSTLDGRLTSGILKSSRPGLIVPSPPSPMALASQSLLAGIRRIVGTVELWVLVLVLVCLGFDRVAGATGVATFTLAHAVGQWVAGRNGFLISAHLPPLFALLTALVPALGLARGRDHVGGWTRPLWMIALLLGSIFGGARPEFVPIDGLSTSEQLAAFFFFTLGVSLGVILITATLLELNLVFTQMGLRRRLERVGFLAGVICVGLLVHRVAALALVPTGLPRAPFELVLLAAVLGVGVSATDHKRRFTSTLFFTLLLAAGLAPGLAGFAVPLGTFVVHASLFLFGVLILLERVPRTPLVLTVGAFAVVGHGWNTGHALAENVSFPVASTVGAGVVALCVFYTLLRSTEPPRTGGLRAGVRILGAVAAVLGAAWRLGEIYYWFDGQVATEAALGLVRLPLLAILLLVSAVAVWPRRRRVLHELGIETRTTAVHWILVGLAFFAVPIGTLTLRNPVFEPEAPRGNDARRVMSQVLWNTYHAFNLTDEDELYDRLSQNVTGNLVDDLYLDSRRRLTSGTREGAEVTVRDVSLVEVDDSAETADTEAGFSYACRWIVTARVRHLQHVHHRQNIYNGKLTIQADGDRWKIARVELTSEDRVVLPWNPT
jgi:hydrogenase/urease accessory protein HupE